MTKTFRIGALLSITTGRALAPFDDIHECLDHALGYPVWTHEMANKEIWDSARANVLAQHPELPTEIDGVDAWTGENSAELLAAYLRDRAAVFGQVLSLEQGTATRDKSPMESLLDVAGDKPVIAIVADDA